MLRCSSLVQSESTAKNVTLETFAVVFASGVPEIVECDLHAAGQCGDVERPVGELGASVLGPAVLSPRLHPVDVVARRVPDPAERSPLRSRLGPPYQAVLIACTPSPVADDR